MSLEQHNIISVIFSIILIIIYIVIGATISLKYFKIKQRTFLLMGLAWILLSMLWWSSVINVFLLIINPEGIGLSAEAYFIFSGILSPFCILFFVTAFTDLTLKKYQHYFQFLVILIGVIYYFVSFYFLITNPRILIIKDEPIKVINSPFITSFTLLSIIIVEVVGISFAIDSINSEKRIIRVKGVLILIAFILLPIGGIIDATLSFEFLEFIDRIILIISVTIFYFGFIMPEWLKIRITDNK